jgi:hypothetical protein
MRTHLCLALAALLLALSAARSDAGVFYHLDTGLPPGQGLHAEVEFASPPASATSGWTITSPADVVRLQALDVPYDLGYHEPTILIGVTANLLPQFFYPFSSSTGAHPDQGSISGYGSWWYGVPAVTFDFGPGGSGDVLILQPNPIGVDHDGRQITGPISIVARGTWVLGPAPSAPEPASWVLVSFPLFLGLACACRRRRRAA